MPTSEAPPWSAGGQAVLPAALGGPDRLREVQLLRTTSAAAATTPPGVLGDVLGNDSVTSGLVSLTRAASRQAPSAILADDPVHPLREPGAHRGSGVESVSTAGPSLGFGDGGPADLRSRGPPDPTAAAAALVADGRDLCLHTVLHAPSSAALDAAVTAHLGTVAPLVAKAKELNHLLSAGSVAAPESHVRRQGREAAAELPGTVLRLKLLFQVLVPALLDPALVALRDEHLRWDLSELSDLWAEGCDGESTGSVDGPLSLSLEPMGPLAKDLPRRLGPLSDKATSMHRWMARRGEPGGFVAWSRRSQLGRALAGTAGQAALDVITALLVLLAVGAVVVSMTGGDVESVLGKHQHVLSVATVVLVLVVAARHAADVLRRHAADSAASWQRRAAHLAGLELGALSAATGAQTGVTVANMAAALGPHVTIALPAAALRCFSDPVRDCCDVSFMSVALRHTALLAETDIVFGGAGSTTGTESELAPTSPSKARAGPPSWVGQPAIVIASDRGEIVFATPNVCRLLEAPLEAIVGRTVGEFFEITNITVGAFTNPMTIELKTAPAAVAAEGQAVSRYTAANTALTSATATPAMAALRFAADYVGLDAAERIGPLWKNPGAAAVASAIVFVPRERGAGGPPAGVGMPLATFPPVAGQEERSDTAGPAAAGPEPAGGDKTAPECCREVVMLAGDGPGLARLLKHAVLWGPPQEDGAALLAAFMDADFACVDARTGPFRHFVAQLTMASVTSTCLHAHAAQAGHRVPVPVVVALVDPTELPVPFAELVASHPRVFFVARRGAAASIGAANCTDAEWPVTADAWAALLGRVLSYHDTLAPLPDVATASDTQLFGPSARRAPDERRKPIGRGANSGVYKVETHGTTLAVKRIVDEQGTHERSARTSAVESDFDNMVRIAHPNVVQHFFARRERHGAGSVLEVYMELCRETLREKLDVGSVSGDVLYETVSGVLRALRHLHEQSVVHCDIKPQNVLFRDGVPKVGDFGTAVRVDDSGRGPRDIRGTLPYMAPEVCLSEPVTFASDIFSFGCLVVETLGLSLQHQLGDVKMHLPLIVTYFRSMAEDATCEIVDGGQPINAIRQRQGEPLLKALRSCLARDPLRRPQAGILLEGSVFQDRAAFIAAAEALMPDRPGGRSAYSMSIKSGPRATFNRIAAGSDYPSSEDRAM